MSTYEWDFEDRLVKVTKADGTVVDNVYDVDGVLVRTSVNGVATDLLVDTSGGLSHVVAEIDGSGTVTALYVRAGDMLLEEIRGGVAKMYEADGLGSVRGLLDVSGAKTDSYAYEAFGSTVSTTGNDLNPYRFAGERLVDSVGFYQNRARWLDTRTGRFVSIDPAKAKERNPLTLHPYLYAGAEPVLLVDSTGREFDLPSLMASVSILSFSATAVLLSGCTTNPLSTVAGGLLTPSGGANHFKLSLLVRMSLQMAFSYEGTRYDLGRARIILEPGLNRSFNDGDEIYLSGTRYQQYLAQGDDLLTFTIVHELVHSAQKAKIGNTAVDERDAREMVAETREGGSVYDLARFPGLRIIPLELLDVVDEAFPIEAIAGHMTARIYSERLSYGLYEAHGAR